METKTVSNRMSSLIVLFDMQSNYFKSAIDGISDKDAGNRLGKKANHIAWIAGSMVYERYELARSLEVDLKQSTDELFKDHKGIEDSASYPSLSEFKKDWKLLLHY
ncbi:MAG: hypothetical protein JWN76_1971 [Chitinophagaceae bacterium]|nr:hypothetical protein [Chitinophagaceae bacterium]